MPALLLGIAATVGWIVFDVFASIVTYPHMPAGEWWAFVTSGGVLVILTVIGESLAHRSQQEDETRHSDEHAVLATGTLAIWEQLAALTNTRGQSIGAVMEAANAKIAALESKLNRHEDIFWHPLDRTEKERLIIALAGLGAHSVSVMSHENTDCVELAHDLKHCFESAGWNVARVPLTGGWNTPGASGFDVRQKRRNGPFNKILFDALLTAAKGSIIGEVMEAADTDVSILVGTKRLSND